MNKMEFKMGELSKLIGEIGENITGNFFELIGWNNAIPNESLTCLKSKNHARKGSKKGLRETHGIDYLYKYRSSLESNTVHSLVISVKNSNAAYPNSPISTFKAHITDVAQTIECYNGSPLKGQQLSKFTSYKKSSDIGVLFWLSHSDETYHDVISKLESCRLDSNLKFSSIYVVDNKRIEFLFQVLNQLKLSYSSYDLNYYYPDTSINVSDTEIKKYGKILPVEYINSPVIPFILKKPGKIDTFCIAVSDNFDENEMSELIQSARNYTNDITCDYLFLFPNYLRTKHRKSVLNAIATFENEVENKVIAMSYNPDYRSLNDA